MLIVFLIGLLLYIYQVKETYKYKRFLDNQVKISNDLLEDLNRLEALCKESDTNVTQHDSGLADAFLDVKMDKMYKQISNDWKFNEINAVVKLYERSGIKLPLELIVELMQFDDRERMFEFMEKYRKTYANMLKNPVYKEKRDKLPT